MYSFGDKMMPSHFQQVSTLILWFKQRMGSPYRCSNRRVQHTGPRHVPALDVPTPKPHNPQGPDARAEVPAGVFKPEGACPLVRGRTLELHRTGKIHLVLRCSFRTFPTWKGRDLRVPTFHALTLSFVVKSSSFI